MKKYVIIFLFLLTTTKLSAFIGIIGIFRHGSAEKSRVVTVKYLDHEKTYDVKTIEGNVVIFIVRKW